MSTYGLAIVADVSSVEAAEKLGAHIEQWFADTAGGGDIDYDVKAHGTSARLAINAPGIVVGFDEDKLFTDAPAGRAVICEDGDEYGVVFQVWRLDPAGSSCVYRAYVQDPEEEPEPATADRVITGAQAAAVAAELYGIDPQGLLALEDDPSPVVQGLGLIGSPFMPWLSLFGLGWPKP